MFICSMFIKFVYYLYCFITKQNFFRKYIISSIIDIHLQKLNNLIYYIIDDYYWRIYYIIDGW